MKLSYFSNGFVQKLRESAGQNIEKYGCDIDWMKDVAKGKVFVHESNQVVGPQPQLVFARGESSQNDAENAKRIYNWLGKLSPVLAMEERLWAYLTHYVFVDYMAERWPAVDVNIINRRYLFEGKSFSALCRNGISRLWWAGYLTHDDTRQNKFELTEALFSRQDIQVSLLERSLGKCKKVRFGILDFLRTNQEWLGAKTFTKRIQTLLKEVNLLGGVAILDSLSSEELQEFLRKAGKNLVEADEVG